MRWSNMPLAEGRIKTDKDRIAELEKRGAELEEKLDEVMRWIGLKQPNETPD
jgi:hypothetical protein